MDKRLVVIPLHRHHGNPRILQNPQTLLRLPQMARLHLRTVKKIPRQHKNIRPAIHSGLCDMEEGRRQIPVRKQPVQPRSPQMDIRRVINFHKCNTDTERMTQSARM